MDKGQGLPITTIVIAALALLVLVILFAITTGRLTIFTGAASECGGVCLSTSAPTEQTGVLEKPEFNRNQRNISVNEGCLTYEQLVKGKYIARGIRDNTNKPIPCEACCIITAS